MIYRTSGEVITLVKRFEERALLKSEWTHTTHLTIGLYYCLRFPFGEAVNLMRKGILRLNERYDIPEAINDGYHETLTVFWMITIKQFAETSKCFSLVELANQLINLYNDPQLPFRYYSRELLSSPAAYKQHLPPDLDRFYLFVNSANMLSKVNNEFTLEYL